jgi:1-acyl-sn-glycerol-3-phosphate acyltransferase
MGRDVLAAGFLLLVAAIVIAVAARHQQRGHFTPIQRVFLILATLLARFLWGARGSQFPHLAPGQGAVIVSNHRSSVDPFFIQILADRPIHWMVAREFCRHPAFSWFLCGVCEVIPVNRGGIDTAATKMLIRLASQGELVGVVPEGRINMTERFMLPGRPGAVAIALRAQVPIIPCYIEGSPYDRVFWSPFRMRAAARVVVGQPIDVSDYYGQHGNKQTVERLMVQCLGAIARLADQDDFQPVLAGRHWKPSPEELQRHQADSLRRRGRRGSR